MCFFQKWAKDLNKHFPKAQYRDGQKAHEKMLCVSNHHGDGHQRHREIPSPTQEESYDLEKNNSSHFSQGCGKTKTFPPNAQWYRCCGKHFGCSSENCIRITTRSSTADYFPKGVKREFPIATLTWDLDHKENWPPENWCFWTVVLDKTLESPLDS